MIPSSEASSPLLSLEDLSVTFQDNAVVDGVSLTVNRGEIVGIVGESGSGKSMTALSILRLVPEPGRITRGRILLDNHDILALPEKSMRGIRGGRVAMIFQDPMTSLNPVFTVGDQIAEAVRVHRACNKQTAWMEAVEAMRRVHIAEAERRAKQYPHELSGGMRQRVMIAMALAMKPSLLLADEPTTALDVTVQAQILALVNELRRETGMGVLFITHDFGVVAEVCDRVLVLYAGRVMESATAAAIFSTPKHPYTQGLLASLPDALGPNERRLKFIPGQPPLNPGKVSGCPFRFRCSRVMPGLCEQPLPTITMGPEQTVRCHLYTENGRLQAAGTVNHSATGEHV